MFFLILPRPPISTLFPTRRSSDLSRAITFRQSTSGRPALTPRTITSTALGNSLLNLRKRRLRKFRSEEHTSELQSRFDLVCRLLLEKKNRSYHRYFCRQFV